jgi:peptide deformylase
LLQVVRVVDVRRWESYIAWMTSESDVLSGASLLPILIAPHPQLKARCRRVIDSDADVVREIIPRMFASMYRAPGIGLAAPQVGLGLRLAVVDLQANDRRDPIVMVNPEIIVRSPELATREEGCLSLPHQFADVTRPARVRVRFEDAAGIKQELEADGLLATCLQHEIDHLDGILFVDHISALKRNMLMRKLAKEQKIKAAEKAGA